jgi:hypothetical protein
MFKSANESDSDHRLLLTGYVRLVQQDLVRKGLQALHGFVEDAMLLQRVRGGTLFQDLLAEFRH